MKKIILNSIAILGLAISAFAQDGISIKVSTDNVTDYSSGNGTLIVNSTTLGDNSVDLIVENTTGSTVSWRLTRLKESVPSSWTDATCFGTDCFASVPNIKWCSPVGHEMNIPNGGTSNILFHASVDVAGTGNYKLYIANDCTNYLDSISIQITCTAGIKELKQTPSFSMFPNPSDEFVSIQMNITDKGLVKVVDLLGNVIYSESIITSSKINTSDFKNGVYFVTIESEGLKLASRKLVVRH